MTGTSRRKINSSGKYPCELCNTLNYLEDHHIHGRKIPDYNKAWNRVDICCTCHDKVTRGVIVIEGWQYTTAGRELLWHKC